jgi:hypothetical protein
MSPEEVQRHFLDAAAIQKQESAVGSGEGVWQNITGFGAADLAKRGITLDPERIASLAMTDPVTFVAFGEGFKIVNAATGAALGFARTVPLANQAIDIAKSAIPKTVGGTLQAGGAATRAAGATISAAAPIAKTLGPVAVIGKAAVQGQVPSFGEVLGGLKAGEAFSQTGEGLSAAGKKMGEVGRQFTGAAPAGAAVRRFVDVGNATGSALAEVGKGAALGGAIGAATGETPEDVSGQIAMGGAFGILPAMRAGAGSLVAGEMVKPKGTPTPRTPSPGYGTFPALDAITKANLDAMPEDRRNKINFTRELGRKLSGAQTYVYGTPEQGAQMIAQAKPGISEAAARDAAGHNGFTLDVDGKPVIFLNGSASAEGHELGHALEKALSPEQNARLDAATRANFSDAEWDDMGQRYTSRLLNRELGPNEDWRNALAPHTGGLSPDQYMLRENRADNFDELWKNRGESIGKPEDVYRRIVGALGRGAEAIGVPLVEAKDFSGNPISLRSQKASESALNTLVPPKAGAAPVPTVTPKGPGAPKVGIDPVTKARDFITNNPTDIPERNAGVNDLLDAAQSGGGVRVLYWGAKGDPAGSVTSVRPERRAEIEAQRGAENSKRQLMEKEIFPYKVDNTSKGPQIVGWSPDNFDANAEKLAEWAGQLNRAGTDTSAQLPYGLDVQKGRFTAAGRAELMADAQKFMRNQAAGFTGTGEPVIVPKETAARGYHEPVRTGSAPEPLPQDRADIINYLFHVQIPETASRVAPLHLAAQEVASATGRAPIPPIRPRGEYTEAQLSKAGLPGPRAPMEVNPFRQWVEQTAQQSGVSRPSLIDVSQRLNVGHIEKTVPSLRTEPFNGNTLTLAAGFQPKAPGPAMEWLRSASDEDFSGVTKDFKGKLGGGPTGWAFEVGAAARTPEDLAALKSQYDHWKPIFREQLAARNIDAAMKASLRSQLAREAFEAATGTNIETGEPTNASVGFIRKNVDANYEPPMPGGKPSAEPAVSGGNIHAIEGAAQPPAERLTSPESRKAADEYAESAGLPKPKPTNNQALDNRLMQDLGDYFEDATHSPNDPQTQKSYAAFRDEIITQAKQILDSGLDAEPFTGKGEPYANSAAMIKDVVDNNHLYFLRSAGGFGGAPAGGEISESASKNLMLEPTGIKLHGHELDLNEVTRFVHDYLGHAAEGNEFGPRGEYNAFLKHSQLFTPPAQKALIAELLMQAGWFFQGRHIRRTDRTIPVRGEPDYVPPQNRKFIDPKNLLPSEELTQRVLEKVKGVSGAAQPKFASPEVEDELSKVRSGKSDGQTFNPDGSAFVPPPDKKLDVVTLASVNVPIAELTPERVQSFLAPYSEALSHDGVKAGVFKMADGKTASIDLNAVVDQAHRANSVTFAKANDQQAIFDLSKFENVDTGGAGNTVLKSPEQIAAALPNLLAGEPVDVTATPRRRTMRGSSWWMRQADVSGGQAQPPSKALKSWFGDSEVKDPETGFPKVVYHGTDQDFSTFEPGREGTNSNVFGSWKTKRAAVFFSENPEHAASFPGEKAGARILPVYLKLEHPLDFENGISDADYEALAKAGVSERYLRQLSGQTPSALWEAFDYENGGEHFVASAKKAGYDGVVLGELTEDRTGYHKTYGVFDANQVKSATGNSGSFNPNNPDIQAQPAKRRDEYTMLPGGVGAFSNAWILPGGGVAQLGGQWHHHWLAEDAQGIAEAKKAGLTVPPFAGVDDESTRTAAITKGFGRVKLDKANGVFTVEARAADWPKQRDAVRNMVERNADDIDTIRVHLLNRTGSDLTDSASVPVFQMDTGAEKVAAIPFMGNEVRAARVRATDNPAFRAPGEPEAPLRPDIAEPDYAVYDSVGKHLGTFRDKAKAIAAAGPEGNVVPLRSFGGAAQPKTISDLEEEHNSANAKLRTLLDDRDRMERFGHPEKEILAQNKKILKARDAEQAAFERMQAGPDAGQAQPATNPRTAIKYFNGDATPEVRGTGFRGRATLWDAAKFLSEPNAKLGKLGRESEADMNEHASAIADEAEFALQRDPSAVGWYDDKITKMQHALEGLHPELQTDPNKFMVYKALLAINSNGQGIDTNLARSEMLYNQWKKDGSIDTTSAFGGKNAPAINIGLRNLSDLITARGLDGAREFLNTDYTVGDLKKMGFAIPGELVSTTVKGSVILGPKIGSFYGNLNGDYSSVTMDRWFMRTFNRISGTLTAPLPAPLPRQIENVLSAFKGRKSDMGHDMQPIRESLNEALSGLKSKTMEPEELQDRDSPLAKWLYDRFRTYEGSRFADRSEQNVSVKNLYENLFGTENGEKPGSGSDRAWVRRVMSEAQRQLRERGINLTNADLQALLWYYEKELYAKLYPQNKRSVPTDYAKAAERFVAEQRGQQPGQNQPGPGPSGLVEPRALAK